MALRSQLSHARGLGSGKSGTHHWWMQRVTAIALVPLSIWMILALAGQISESPRGAYLWFISPFNTAGAIMFLIAMFYHAMLGMQVVFEDYIHGPRMKMFALLKLKLCVWFFGVFAIVLVVRVHILAPSIIS